ncbi:T9SS C-terminal target domain-containing protein [Arenibacter aquaticus]|uniref:T9SS C-terminal target domain-containing protein n=1 Tax=Arenibacter aquaticus TaxID=2489054 RepID=A0A3S0ACD5_9FLAO|nr:T9SS type A sorting domain-containing protein [Arenibacter aquaticus]RTE52256.1 T9SS C-terminal target domain-containing protein [Arenibacter aquaticus]
MLVFDYDLNLQEEISFNTVNGLGYNPTNMHFINGHSFMTGTVIASMYEGSDFYGELNFNVKKVSQSTEVKDYIFSGEGTSKTWINWVKKNEHNQYVVHITDKLGPDNLFIGGSRSSEYSSNYYFDSELNQTDVVEDVTRVQWVNPSSVETDPFDLDGFNYHYLFDYDSKTFSLTKNGNVVWNKTWEDNKTHFYDFNVNSEGNLVFRGSFNYGHSHFIGTISLEGAITTINYEGTIHFFKVLENDWIFTHTDRSIVVFSPELEIISKKYSYEFESYINPNLYPSLQIGNRVLVSARLYENSEKTATRVYDQYGNLEKTLYIEGNLRPRYAFLENNDLIILTDDGAHVEHGFSWSVAVLNKFENFVGGNLPNNDLGDLDGDGVINVRDRCENTPLGNPVNDNGCNLFNIGDQNFTIQTVGESCFEKADGKINITTDQSLNYNAILYKEGVELENIEFTDQISFQKLAGGDYQLCLTVTEVSEFEKCFELNVQAVEQLFVESKVSMDSNSLTLELKGSNKYTVQINDKLYNTSKSSITLPLEEPFNSIKVSTEKNCQGLYEEQIISSLKSNVYPNPSLGIFNIYLGLNITQKIPYEIFTSNGVLIKNGEIMPRYGNLVVDISELSQGQYYYIIEIENNKVPYTLIKK